MQNLKAKNHYVLGFIQYMFFLYYASLTCLHMLHCFIFQDNFCITLEHTFSQNWVLCRLDLLQCLSCLLLGEYNFITDCISRQKLYMLMISVFYHYQFFAFAMNSSKYVPASYILCLSVCLPPILYTCHQLYMTLAADSIIN